LVAPGMAIITAGGDVRVFCSYGLVGSLSNLELILLFWPLLGPLCERAARLWRLPRGSRAA